MGERRRRDRPGRASHGLRPVRYPRSWKRGFQSNCRAISA